MDASGTVTGSMSTVRWGEGEKAASSSSSPSTISRFRIFSLLSLALGVSPTTVTAFCPSHCDRKSPVGLQFAVTTRPVRPFRGSVLCGSFSASPASNACYSSGSIASGLEATRSPSASEVSDNAPLRQSATGGIRATAASFVRRLVTRLRSRQFVPARRARQMKRFLVMLGLVLSLIFRPVPMEHAAVSPRAAHAAASTAAATRMVSSETSKQKQRLSYEDRLVQKYVEKNMFKSIDDGPENAFESTYQELVEDMRKAGEGGKEVLLPPEDEFWAIGRADVEGGEEAVTQQQLKKEEKEKKEKKEMVEAGGEKKVTRMRSFEYVVKSTEILSTFLVKTFRLKGGTATRIACLLVLSGTVTGVLMFGQNLIGVLKFVLTRQEGERYGGKDYTAIEKAEDDLDEDDDDDDDDDGGDDDDEDDDDED